MSVIGDELRRELRDPEYSEGYADSFLNAYIATQTKVIREQRGFTQTELARRMGTTQTAISRIENVNYSAWNIKTLKKIAKAFNVRLRVSFEAYGSLPAEVMSFEREYLERDARDNDPGLWSESASMEQILKVVGGSQQREFSMMDAARAYASADNGTNIANITAGEPPTTESQALKELYGADFASFLNLLDATDNAVKVAPRKVISGNAFRKRRASLRRKQKRYGRTKTGSGTAV